jgi:hypothetical protein
MLFLEKQIYFMDIVPEKEYLLTPIEEREGGAWQFDSEVPLHLDIHCYRPTDSGRSRTTIFDGTLDIHPIEDGVAVKAVDTTHDHTIQSWVDSGFSWEGMGVRIGSVLSDERIIPSTLVRAIPMESGLFQQNTIEIMSV